jgi:rRNA pseudouridine-1189 N-methylase Emg1 (Nep1/Mra1 family)
LPFDDWSFSKNTSDIIVESIKIGSGMGGSIYITVYPNEIITVPKKMNKAWANLYSLISNYLKDKKYKEGQNKKIVALRNAIQQVDDHIKGMNGGW